MKSIIIVFVILFLNESLFSQGLDTVWTYNLQPDYLKNGVFSPDNQFVFASHYDYNFPEKLKLSKFDKVSGAKIWTTDTIMGIKQFSDDGKFFYTYDLKKYSYPEFQLIGVIGEYIINKRVKGYTISELDDFGIAYLFESKVDSNLVVFSPKEMKIKNIISYSLPAGIAENAICSPTSNEFVTSKHFGYYISKELFYDYFFHLWDKKNNKIIKLIFQQLKSKLSDDPIIHYSPDGKLLGILTDSLRLYETQNYNWVYTLPIQWPRYFNFAQNSINVYISTLENFIQLYNIDSKKIISSNNFIYTKRFINEGVNNEVVTSWLADKLTLIRISQTSIVENKSDIKVKNIDNKILELCCFDNINEFINYSIADLSGKTIVINLKTNIQSDNSIKVDINKLSNGLYLININSYNKVFTHKFIIVR